MLTEGSDHCNRQRISNKVNFNTIRFYVVLVFTQGQQPDRLHYFRKVQTPRTPGFAGMTLSAEPYRIGMGNVLPPAKMS